MGELRTHRAFDRCECVMGMQLHMYSFIIIIISISIIIITSHERSKKLKFSEMALKLSAFVCVFFCKIMAGTAHASWRLTAVKTIHTMLSNANT